MSLIKKNLKKLSSSILHQYHRIGDEYLDGKTWIEEAFQFDAIMILPQLDRKLEPRKRKISPILFTVMTICAATTDKVI